MLALQTHGVIDEFLVFLESFDVIFKLLLFVLHLYNLLGQVIVHREQFLILLLQLLICLLILRKRLRISFTIE